MYFLIFFYLNKKIEEKNHKELFLFYVEIFIKI